MATVKKTVKKTEKKPAAKKTATKTAATKTAVKKPAAKTAVKKTAVKKTTVKKSDVKKPAAKTASAKTAVKAAVKKPAAKTAAVKKTTAKKPAVSAAVKKNTTRVINKPVEAKQPEAHFDDIDPNVKYRDLFEAFKMGKLPFSQGFIVSSFFNDTSAYSIYEIVSYAGVKEIFPTGDGLQFVTGGKKLHILVEPDTYHFKPVEPVSRAEGERIPKRFNELETIIAKNQCRIMVAKEPVETYGSFTVLRPQGINFAVVFYQLPDMFASIARFFEDSLNRQRKIPQSDARKAALFIVDTLKKHMGFEGEYS
ncbi:MAG: hypothetical protein FWC06_06730 [Treponema sp.]|nr:hypothetical protein [Treponema sp.]